MHRPAALAVVGVAFVSVAALASGCHMGLAMLAFGANHSNGPYEPGAIADELGPDSVRTLACLDVGFAIEQGARPLLETHVGNRCVHAEPFDLSRLVLRGKDPDGGERVVRLVDPRHEIKRLHLGALERGHDRIRIESLDGVVEVCFDLADVAPDAPHARPLPLCLEREPEGWRAERS